MGDKGTQRTAQIAALQRIAPHLAANRLAGRHSAATALLPRRCALPAAAKPLAKRSMSVTVTPLTAYRAEASEHVGVR
jgi:hypothetical protein